MIAITAIIPIALYSACTHGHHLPELPSSFLLCRNTLPTSDDVDKLLIQITLANGSKKIELLDKLKTVAVGCGKIVPVLVQSMSDGDSAIRSRAAVMLGECHDNESIKCLIRSMLADTDANVRIISAKSLGGMGAFAKVAIPYLAIVMVQPRSYDIISTCWPSQLSVNCLGCAASHSLAMIGTDSVESLSAIACGSQHITIARLNAIGALVSMKQMAKNATTCLIRLVTDHDEEIRLDAIESLVIVDPESIQVKRAILTALADESAYVRVVAAAALLKVDRRNVISEPILCKAIESNDNRVKWRAITELGEMGAVSNDTIHRIASHLKSDDESIKIASIKALGRIGVGAKIVAPELEKLLVDGSDTVRKAARAALDRIR